MHGCRPGGSGAMEPTAATTVAMTAAGRRMAMPDDCSERLRSRLAGRELCTFSRLRFRIPTRDVFIYSAASRQYVSRIRARPRRSAASAADPDGGPARGRQAPHHRRPRRRDVWSHVAAVQSISSSRSRTKASRRPSGPRSGSCSIAQNLYIAVVCFDSAPGAVIVSQSRRDADLDDTDSIQHPPRHVQRRPERVRLRHQPIRDRVRRPGAGQRGRPGRSAAAVAAASM